MPTYDIMEQFYKELNDTNNLIIESIITTNNFLYERKKEVEEKLKYTIEELEKIKLEYKNKKENLDIALELLTPDQFQKYIEKSTK